MCWRVSSNWAPAGNSRPPRPAETDSLRRMPIISDGVARAEALLALDEDVRDLIECTPSQRSAGGGSMLLACLGRPMRKGLCGRLAARSCIVLVQHFASPHASVRGPISSCSPAHAGGRAKPGVARVRALCLKRNQQVHLDLFEARYLGEAELAPSWEELGARHGMNHQTARERADTVARHFRLVLRRMLRNEVTPPDRSRRWPPHVMEAAIDEEIKVLLSPLKD